MGRYRIHSAAPTALPQVAGGKARALAVSGARRSAAFAQIPTFDEAGVKGYEVSNWFGLVAPKGTPAPVIARLHAEIVKAMAAKDTREKIAAQGGEPGGIAPAEFGRLIEEETRRWAEVISRANIKPE